MRVKLFAVTSTQGKTHEAVLAETDGEAQRLLGERMSERGAVPFVWSDIGSIDREDLLSLLLPRMEKHDNPMVCIASLEFIRAEYSELLDSADVAALKRVRGKIFEYYAL